MSKRNPIKELVEDSILEIQKNVSIKDKEVQDFISDVVEQVVKSTLKVKIDKAFKEEINAVEFESINEVATHLLSDNYIEVIQMANTMIDGDVEWSGHECVIMLRKLAGYCTRCAVAAAIYEGQYKKAYAERFLSAKEGANRTDGTAHQMAILECAEVDAKKILFWTLKESMLEMINILKKMLNDFQEERRQSNAAYLP